MTSAYTLSRIPDTMLATLVSGRCPSLPRQSDGSIFIDRDGTHFRYIVNYLRGDRGIESLPDGELELTQLMKEAKYYRINGLVSIISIKLDLPPTVVN